MTPAVKTLTPSAPKATTMETGPEIGFGQSTTTTRPTFSETTTTLKPGETKPSLDMEALAQGTATATLSELADEILKQVDQAPEATKAVAGGSLEMIADPVQTLGSDASVEDALMVAGDIGSEAVNQLNPPPEKPRTTLKTAVELALERAAKGETGPRGKDAELNDQVTQATQEENIPQAAREPIPVKPPSPSQTEVTASAAEATQAPEPTTQLPELTTEETTLIQTTYKDMAANLLRNMGTINLSSLNIKDILFHQSHGLGDFFEAVMVTKADLTPGSAGSEFVLGALERMQNPPAELAAVRDKLRSQLQNQHPLADRALEKGWIDERDYEKAKNSTNPSLECNALVEIALRNGIEQGAYPAVAELMSDLTQNRIKTITVAQPDGPPLVIPDMGSLLSGLELPGEDKAKFNKMLSTRLEYARKKDFREILGKFAGKGISTLIIMAMMANLLSSLGGSSEGGH